MLFTSKDNLITIFNRLQKAFFEAAKERQHGFKTMAFATTDNGTPDLRNVILRAVDDQFHFYFYTDSRSRKVGQIHQNQNVTLLFYDPEEKVQVKIKGSAYIHHQDHLAKLHWTKVSGEAKRSYNSKVSPGSTLLGPDEAYHWNSQLDDRYFSVIEIQCIHLEALQLYGTTHLRIESHLMENNWRHQWLAP